MDLVVIAGQIGIGTDQLVIDQLMIGASLTDGVVADGDRSG
jgi:hypothetical protein